MSAPGDTPVAGMDPTASAPPPAPGPTDGSGPAARPSWRLPRPADLAEAYALASMAVSFRVTQYAHQTGSAYDTIPPKAVHAVVDKSLFSPAQRERVDRWLRPGARP